MNRLKGRIIKKELSGGICRVEVKVKEHVFAAILLEDQHFSPHLKEGREVTLLFKETEVCLAKGLSGSISLSNRIASVIEEIIESNILTRVVMNDQGQKTAAVITTASAKRMDLKVGQTVEWLVKANEIILSLEV